MKRPQRVEPPSRARQAADGLVVQRVEVRGEGNEHLRGGQRIAECNVGPVCRQAQRGCQLSK